MVYFVLIMRFILRFAIKVLQAKTRSLDTASEAFLSIIGLVYPFDISNDDITSKPYRKFDIITARSAKKEILLPGEAFFKRKEMARITSCSGSRVCYVCGAFETEK